MTEAMVKRVTEDKKDLLIYECMYHADDEIVCAGISAISFALVNYVSVTCPENARSRIKPGHVSITAKYTKNTEEAFKVALFGLLAIEMSHPTGIKVYENILPQ